MLCRLRGSDLNSVSLLSSNTAGQWNQVFVQPPPEEEVLVGVDLDPRVSLDHTSEKQKIHPVIRAFQQLYHFQVVPEPVAVCCSATELTGSIVGSMCYLGQDFLCLPASSLLHAAVSGDLPGASLLSAAFHCDSHRQSLAGESTCRPFLAGVHRFGGFLKSLEMLEFKLGVFKV